MKTREKHRVARRVRSDRPFTWDAGQRFIARSASLFFHPCVRTADHSPQSFFTWTNKRQRHEGQRTFPLDYLSTRICPSLTSVQECPSLFPNLSHRESFVPGYRATNWHLAAFENRFHSTKGMGMGNGRSTIENIIVEEKNGIQGIL